MNFKLWGHHSSDFKWYLWYWGILVVAVVSDRIPILSSLTGMYFLIFNRDDNQRHDLQRSYYPIHSLLPREYIGKYCPRDSIS